MATITEFLTSISRFLRAKDATKLQEWLKVEPPLPSIYYTLGEELRSSYTDSDTLERQIIKLIPENDNGKADEGDTWPGFIAFVKEYLEFWRDVNFEDLLATHAQLSSLVNACITALSNATYGVIVLPTTIQLSSALAKLAMTLDKRPDLTRRLRTMSNIDQGGETRKTLVEGTAESIQRAFTMCLTERSANRNGIGRDGKPEGKKIGIYSFANLVLKLLFQCRKTRLANQLFTNISQHSPPLHLYPASQRVTYLYYLGRFLFSNNHFFRAQLSLSTAYAQCHAQCVSQRRLILTYLIAANLLLGRFPTTKLLSRPEATGLSSKFLPIMQSIRQGNLQSFKVALGPSSGNEQWFFRKGLLLPLLYRTELLVWRSLSRQVFKLTYVHPTDPMTRKAPTLDLIHLLAAARYMQRRLEGSSESTSTPKVPPHTNAIFMAQPPPSLSKKRKLAAHEGVIYANRTPNLIEIEAIIASLVQQGLLGGFISHAQSRFAILGAKKNGPLAAGFPIVWEVVRRRAGGEEAEVPGWVREERKFGMGGVVNLSGIARPVGSGG